MTCDNCQHDGKEHGTLGGDDSLCRVNGCDCAEFMEPEVEEDDND